MTISPLALEGHIKLIFLIRTSATIEFDKKYELHFSSAILSKFPNNLFLASCTFSFSLCYMKIIYSPLVHTFPKKTWTDSRLTLSSFFILRSEFGISSLGMSLTVQDLCL